MATVSCYPNTYPRNPKNAEKRAKNGFFHLKRAQKGPAWPPQPPQPMTTGATWCVVTTRTHFRPFRSPVGPQTPLKGPEKGVKRAKNGPKMAFCGIFGVKKCLKGVQKWPKMVHEGQECCSFDPPKLLEKFFFWILDPIFDPKPPPPRP